MRKKTLVGGLVIALAALYPIASNYHGSKLHEHVDKEVGKINQYLSQELGSKMSVQAKLDQSNMFSSQYTVTLNLGDGKEVPLFKQNIEHGPFPLNAVKKGRFVPVSYASRTTLIRNTYTEPLFTMASDEEPFVAEYFLGYDKKLKGTFNISPLAYTENDLNLDTGAFELRFNTDVETHEAEVDVDFEGLTLEGDASKNKRIHIRTGEAGGHYAFANQDGVSSYQLKGELNAFSMHDDGVTIEYPQLSIEENLSDDDKAINYVDKTEYQDLVLNDVSFGQIKSQFKIKDLDSKAAAQVRDIVAKIFADVFKRVAQDPQKSTEQHIEDVMEGYKVPLGASLISLLNQSPELGYDFLSWINKGGESRASLQVGVLPFAADFTGQPADMVLNALSKVSLQLKTRKEALSQFFMDVFSLMAQVNKVAVPNEADKKALDAIMADVEHALIESKLAKIDAEGNLSFAIVADAGAGKSIQTLQTVQFNGDDVPLLMLALQLDSQLKQLESALEQGHVSERLSALAQRFIVSKAEQLFDLDGEASEADDVETSLDNEAIFASIPDLSLAEVRQRIEQTEKEIQDVKKLSISNKEKEATLSWLNELLSRLKEHEASLLKK